MSKPDQKPKRRRRRRPRRGSDRMQPPSSIDEADRRLRDKIQRFAYQERFRPDFEKAIDRYFGEGTIASGTLTADERQLPGFQEWFFFDPVTGEGEPIIDVFAREVGPMLSELEQDLLKKWRQWNRFRLFEVQEVMPGEGVVVKDLLSDETLEVHDHSASRNLTRWELFVGRPLYTDRLHFTGSGVPLRPSKKDAVLEYSRQLLADFQERHPDATLDEFYQHHGLDIMQFMQRKATERPAIITPEGHPVEACTAYFRVTDADAVAERLHNAEEFNFAGPSEDDPDALHFNWLLRGRSHVPEQPKPDREALELQSEVFAGPDSPKYLSLGDITLGRDRLALSCMSRARLEAGKTLLNMVLGSLIKHQRDKVESLDEYMARQPAAAPAPKRISGKRAERLERELLEERYSEWADQPIPALDGKTPREAVHDPEGRAKVVEVLKTIEYTEEQRRQAGKPWFDVNRLRRELGLPIP